MKRQFESFGLKTNNFRKGLEEVSQKMKQNETTGDYASNVETNGFTNTRRTGKIIEDEGDFVVMTIRRSLD